MISKGMLLSAAILLSLTGYVLAGEGMNHEEHATADQAQGTETPAAVEVGNTICPVSGEKVGGMGQVIKHEYNGKIYNLCCAMCAKDFKKDPEKYSKIAEEEVAGNAKTE